MTKKRTDGSGRRRRRAPEASPAEGASRSTAEREGQGGVAAAPVTGPTIPAWLPAVLFVALPLLLFGAFVFSDAMLYGGDTLGLGYVARAFYADALRTLGTIPDWAPLILGGTPFLEALSGGDALYPPSLLLLVLMETHRALGWKLVIHYVAAGFFMFGWVRAIGASRAAALLAGTSYLLAPYFVSLVHPGHDGKIFVTALAPLLFWAVERHFQQPSLRTIAWTALVIGLVILTTHFQMAYFLFGGVGLYAIIRAVELWKVGGSSGPPRPSLVRFSTFLLAAVLGAGVAAVQLVPAVEYVTESSRRVATTREAAGESGVAWSSSWSLHPEEAMALVIPEFAGNDAGGHDWSQRTYWGRNVTRDNHPSSGLVILLLAAVSFAGAARRSLRWFFVGLGALALLFALGAHTPVWGFFYAVVPGIRLFRAPDQVMFLFVFAAVTLGALGTDRLLAVARARDEQDGSPVLKVLVGAAAALGLLALLAGSGALTSIWTSTIYTNVPPERLQALEALQPFIARGAGVSLLLGLATAGVAWAAHRAWLAPAGVVAALVVLVALDEARVSRGFIQVLDFEEWAAPDGFVQAVQQREAGSEEPYRMLSFRGAGQDVRPALDGIELAAGHHPNDLARYRELIGMVGSGVPQNLYDRDLRRLLNVRYVLWPEYEAGVPLLLAPPDEAGGTLALAAPEAVLARSQLRDGSTYEALYAEDDLPRARLVASSTVRSDTEAVEYMLSDAFDPEAEVVLAEPPPIELDGAPAEGTVEWTERTPNRLALRVTTERPALLVIADNWFPAWHARVDEAEAPVLRAYHTLRAVPVPAGAHTVEMVYRSSVVRISSFVSLVVTLALLAGLAAGYALDRRSAGGGA